MHTNVEILIHNGIFIININFFFILMCKTKNIKKKLSMDKILK